MLLYHFMGQRHQNLQFQLKEKVIRAKLNFMLYFKNRIDAVLLRLVTL